MSDVIVTAEIKAPAAPSDAPATHVQVHDSKRMWRKGAAGCGEFFNGQEWQPTYWTNDELDTCDWFKRLDGKLQRGQWARNPVTGKYECGK